MTRKLKKNPGLKKFLMRICITALTLFLTFMLILDAAKPPQYSFSIGDISDVDIFAPRDVVDELSTARKRDAAASAVPDQYVVDFDRTATVMQDVNALFDAVVVIGGRAADRALKVQELLSLTNAPDKNTADFLMRMPSAGLSAYTSTLSSAMRTAMENGVIHKAESIQQIIESLPDEYKNDATEDILSRFITENKFFDINKTTEEKEKARAAVDDIIYKKNQELVRRGTPVTEEQLSVLNSLGLLEGGLSYFSTTYLVGLFGFLLICFMLCGVYLWLYRRDTLLNIQMFLMMHITFLLQIFVFFVIAKLGLSFFIPVSLAAILLSVFVDVRVSIVLNVFIAMIGTVVMDGDILYLISSLLIAVVAALLFRNIRNFSSVAVTTLYHGLATALIMTTTSMLVTANGNVAVKNGMVDFGASLLCGIIAGGLIPFFQLIFDIATPLKLTELADPNKKLLRRLTVEAPGTYHHSLMVGNLVEAACNAIGANGLLARVSALYHDIGKLEHPMYFKENQLNSNPHDELTPEQSANIILRHVTHGDRLAREHRLPGVIRNIIAQHHGTTKAAYFYKLAQLREGPPPVDADFTYPGPRPKTKEAALLMLADSCEASVRSLDDKSSEAVMNMINSIFNGKIMEGQLDECPITLEELSIAAEAFGHLFEGYFHNRVKYDEFSIRADNERRKENEAQN